ncbi:hypothetical protein [Nocardioides daphniae]|uniref:Uncharacterized protein n=1 Tax=Nocardioides daphniae TaxID=402297 RepID=A0A4P7UFL5_9ACTN|nr:hypothetical protein [Nocardioides daphniae]QCC78078.1 hypothetical protein E2C04_14405 [Nocardioides daphniae]GGD22351.1 hypothetical protein GCM10007231_21800 [Nocardioides daphniae]
MKRQTTWASRLTAVTTALISLLLCERLTHDLSTSSIVLLATVAALGLGAAVKMALHNCFESHLLVSLVTGATLVGTLLSVTVGLPGASRSSLTPVHAGLIGLPILTLGLQNADARLRRRRRDVAAAHPYAS